MDVSQMNKFRKYVKTLDIILDDKCLSWPERYELIFHYKRTYLLKDIGLSGFTWYNPDTSYKEDVLAYVNEIKRVYEYLCGDLDDDYENISSENLIDSYLKKLYF